MKPLGTKILVLDKGFVEYISHYGTDMTIVDSARVSYQSQSIMKTDEENKKLLAYLYRNKHTSPFEMVKITFVIKMPIFIARQYIRHRMQNVNEVSARYTEVDDDFYIPHTWRTQDAKNKQGSVAGEDMVAEWHGRHSGSLEAHCRQAYDLYLYMIDSGVAREMARMVLPLNIYTTMRVCWDLKNLLHFITLREDAHAQAEIQEYSKAIKSFLVELFPWTMECYEKYKFPCVEVPNA